MCSCSFSGFVVNEYYFCLFYLQGTQDYIQRPVDIRVFEAAAASLRNGSCFYPVEFEVAAGAFLHDHFGMTQDSISFANCAQVLNSLVSFVGS